MPIYDFKCSNCNREAEVLQSISDSAPTCPACGHGMQHWYKSAPAVHGATSIGREKAMRSLPQCGKGCRCCP